ncbi:MAG: helix-turn-helix domain-containing protein [Atopobium minutum]|uniref:helix-turn-helix domain-containing protein n=1 Tax=Atopobium minutum TaxID=1381 RepID=UPI001DCD84C7|nr:helix-turn-helix transcriptional regulator [Atopobium minutum]MBS4874128.1 helix-turn-helix domain-containing protein [Atopobium minutum]
MKCNMRAERIRAGLSAGEVGKHINRSAHSVLLYETGKVDPPGTVLIGLSKLYDKEIDYLMADSSDRN